MNNTSEARRRVVVVAGCTCLVTLAATVTPWLAPNQAHAQTPLSNSSSAKTNAPLTVSVSVAATDPNGNRLNYRWRSSDGQIGDINSSRTTWKLPGGPGLHFAYVLVANGKGGYAEKRVVVDTDSIGSPITSTMPLRLKAPSAPVPKGETYRMFTDEPDLFSFVQDDNNTVRFPLVGFAKSDLKNQTIFRGMTPTPSAENTNVFCGFKIISAIFGNLCGMISPDQDVNGVLAPTDILPNVAVTDYINRDGPNYDINGQVVQADAKSTPCGTQNEFFGVESTATAALLDSTGKAVAGPVRVNSYGYYVFPPTATAASVSIRCEGAVPQSINLAANGAQGLTTIPGTAPPIVQSITATLANGTVVGQFILPPAGSTPFQPSDVVNQDDKFLAYKGLDTRRGACAYYVAVGAASKCDSSGNSVGTISFDDWKRMVKIDQYAQPGTPQYSATYINKADLNLTRNHHSVSYGPNQTAAYVCNHLGPKVLDPLQAEIDQVIDDTVNGKNLVACVAMDYTSTRGVNGGNPYIRFLIFSPNGSLLPSVNLDGRREKFVPGTCVVCHGGDHYAGKFQEDGTGPANIGAHFLPYDTGNFLFSSKPGLTEADQSLAIYFLNQNVLNAGPTIAAKELIAGWYAGGTTSLDKNYLPASWQGRGQLAADFYRGVIARSCRGCHVSQVEGYNWDHYDNIDANRYRGSAAYDLLFTVGCGGGNDTFRNHGMPNSAVTFNRFWNSAGTAVDQPQLLNDFSNSVDYAAALAVLNCTAYGP